MANNKRKWPMVMACSVAGLWAVGAGTGAKSSASGAATATTAAPSQAAGLSELEARCLQVGQALTNVGVTGNDRARFMAIAAAESNCRNISNKGLNKDGTEDVCPLQINTTANADLIKRRNIRDLHVCADVANKVLGRQGWNAWATYSGRKHHEFVPMALKLNGQL